MPVILTHLNLELYVFIHRINMIENIINDSWNNSLHFWIAKNSLHCVCFTRRSLSVSKYGSIVSFEHVIDDCFSSFLIDYLLVCVRLENFIEDINFSLKNCENVTQVHRSEVSGKVKTPELFSRRSLKLDRNSDQIFDHYLRRKFWT